MSVHRCTDEWSLGVHLRGWTTRLDVKACLSFGLGPWGTLHLTAWVKREVEYAVWTERVR